MISHGANDAIVVHKFGTIGSWLLSVFVIKVTSVVTFMVTFIAIDVAHFRL